MNIINGYNFGDFADEYGLGVTVALTIFIILLTIACPFLWALVYQLVWNFGVVWFATQIGVTLPTIGYWAGMLLYLVVHFIRHILTPKVKVNIQKY